MLAERAPRMTNREGRPYAKLVSRETGQSIEIPPLVFDALMLTKNPAITGEVVLKVIRGEVNQVEMRTVLTAATKESVGVYLSQAEKIT